MPEKDDAVAGFAKLSHYCLYRLPKAVEWRPVMNDKTIWRMIKALLLIVLVIGSVGFVWVLANHNAFKMEQNIYFTEFDGRNTAIFKYDPVKSKLTELVKVPGRLNACVVDKEENSITGFLYEWDSGSVHFIDIIEYDIKTGTVTEKNVIGKMNELTGDPSWVGTLYDGGNKVIVSYRDKEDVEWLLSYDIETGKSENVFINEKRVSQIQQYPAINEKALWYRCYNTIYRYDWQTETEHVVSHLSNDGVLEPTAGLIAYIDSSAETGNDEIFLYDIDRYETSRITTGGWNIHYGDLHQTSAMWTSDGRQFCYVKSFPLMFNAADRSLMIYDLESDKHRCIYKVRNTTNEFQYIPYH